MARLQGHATDLPGRWKEPGAFPAADHTAQRARQGRGRPSIRHRVRGQCDKRRCGAGSLIPHAGAIRALVIPVIEAAFRTDPMAPARGADRGVAGGRATRRRAVRVAAIARRADREEAVAPPTGFLAKRRVHDVGAASRTDWTRRPNRGTRETTGSVRRPVPSGWTSSGRRSAISTSRRCRVASGPGSSGAPRRRPPRRRAGRWF